MTRTFSTIRTRIFFFFFVSISVTIFPKNLTIALCTLPFKRYDLCPITDFIGNWVKETQLKVDNNVKNEARPPRRLAYTWRCSKKCERLQPFRNVVLCVCWRSTFHNVISPAEKYHKSLPRGPVCSISMRGSLLFPPTLHAVFAKHSKTRNNESENGSIFGREDMTPNFEM